MTTTRARYRTVSLLGIVGIVAVLTAAWAPRRTPAVQPPPLVSPLPQVDEVNPLGVRRGFATDLNIRGLDLAGNTRLIAPFKFAVEAPKPGESDATAFKTRITVDPATPLGIYPVRVLTDEGLSAPFPLAVGQLPQIQEKEPNDNIDWQVDESKWTAQRITVPTVIEGELGRSEYADCFRFRGERGQRFFAQTQGAGIGSRIDADICLLSIDREYAPRAGPRDGDPADPPLFATLPHSGDFLFVVNRASARPNKGTRRGYRLTLGVLPAAAEVYPLGGRRGDTIRVELSGGTLAAPIVVPVALTPQPGESAVRVRAVTTLRGPDGAPLDVEALPPLIAGDMPEVLEPLDPAAPPPKATPPVALNGRIAVSAWKNPYPEIFKDPDRPGDQDRFVLNVAPGQRLRVQVASLSLGSALYAYVKVLDARGRELDAPSVFAAYARKDEPGTAQYIVPACGGVPEHVTYDPTVEFSVPDGQSQVTLVVSGQWSYRLERGPRAGAYGGSGHSYRVTVLPVIPGFSIALDDAQVSVPRGGVAAVGVTVDRDSYDGPISLRVADPPAGLIVRPGAIAAGQNVGAFTLEAAPDATFGPLVLDVIGEGRGPAGPIVVHASKVLLFGPPTTEPYKVEADKNFYIHFPAYLRTPLSTQYGLFAAATKAAALRLDAPAGPIDVRRGSGTTFKVTVKRPAGIAGALTLRPLGLTPGLSIPEIEIGEAATEATVKVDVAHEHPLGAATIVLSGQGKVGGIERRFVVPAVTLEVVRGPKGE